MYLYRTPAGCTSAAVKVGEWRLVRIGLTQYNLYTAVIFKNGPRYSHTHNNMYRQLYQAIDILSPGTSYQVYSTHIHFSRDSLSND